MADELTPGATPEPTADPTPTPQGEGAASTPDIASELAALRSAIESQGQPQASPLPDPNTDLFDFLTGQDDFAPGDDVVPTQQGVVEPSYELDEEAALEEQFNELVQERVEGLLLPFVQQMQADRHREQLGALIQQFPDLQEPDVQAAVRSHAADIAAELGMPGLVSHPKVVRLAYLAEKALRAAGSEVDADEVRGQGASLETQAGATAPQGSDPADEFKRELLQMRGGASRFEL